MHGRKKVTQSETEKKVLKEKAHVYSTLVDVIMDRRTKKEYSMESLILTEKLLKANPDFYTLWNYRRQILMDIYSNSIGLKQHIHEQVTSSQNQSNKIIVSGNEQIEAIVKKELDVSAEGIRKNPKSCKYCCYYYLLLILIRAINPKYYVY